jgi:hypothetical protein
MVFTFVDFGAFGGSSNASDDEDEDEATEDEDGSDKKSKKKSGGGVCAQAAACCKVISGPAGAACSNYENTMMPVEGCRQALDGFKTSAKSMGKKCD